MESEHSMEAEPKRELELLELPEPLKLVFCPLDKRAFGIAIGAVSALSIFLVTVVHCLWGAPELGQVLGKLDHFFAGYRPTFGGAVIGALWGLWIGFVAGFVLALCRNFFIACWLFFIRTKARLQATRNFLDHM